MDVIEFGKFLKTKRKELGLTIIELANLSGVSHPYISQIENGKKGMPSTDVLSKLAEPLGLKFSELMGLAGHLNSSQVEELLNWEDRAEKRSKLKVSFMQLEFHLLANYGEEFSNKMIPIIQELKSKYVDILGDSYKFNLKSLRDLEKRALEADYDLRIRTESFFIEVLEAIRATRNDVLLEGDLDYLINIPIANYKGISLTASDRKLIQGYLEGLFAGRLAQDED